MNLRKISKKLPIVPVLSVIMIAGVTGVTIFNIGTVFIKKPAAPQNFPQQTAGATSDGPDLTTEVIYRGSPRPEAYTYTHPTAGYTVEVPPNWLLGFIGTPYNPHLATVLHSPDYLDTPDDDGVRRLESGSEIFIYAEAPRTKTPTIRSEVDYFGSLGQVGLGVPTDTTIDGEPAINYFRDIGDLWLPYESAIVAKNGIFYRFMYRTALVDEANPLPSFSTHQAIYDRVLASFKLPDHPPQ